MWAQRDHFYCYPQFTFKTELQLHAKREDEFVILNIKTAVTTEATSFTLRGQ